VGFYPVCVSAAGTLISAIVTIVLVIITAKTLGAYRKQVQIGQDQIRVTQEQTYNQARPVLVPPQDIASLLRTEQGSSFVQWGNSSVVFNGLQNIGTGPAFNIYGLFFGPPVQNLPPTSRYSLWNYGVLAPGTTGPQVTLSQGSSLKSETTIKEHVLYAPDDVDHIGCIVRLTLTYHDIFGRKFASIYDYQSILGWICLGHYEDIESDLRELDDQEPMTQQSRHMYYNMGKRRP
jgi:hypothetical protein